MRQVLKRTGLRAAVALILLQGAWIGRVPDSVGSPQQKTGEARAVEALSKLGVPLQRDLQGVVRWIEAADKEFSDEAMQHLPELPKLEWLEIGGGSVSASGLAALNNCPSLRRLYIHDIRLAGDELAWLASLTKLEALALQRTGIDGRVLKNIKAGSTLAVLNLSGNDIQNDDMEAIALLKGLEVLALADTKVTSAGIASLQGMQRLNELNLMNCGILDSDLETFLSMPNLRIVYAEGCNLGDWAIQQMKFRFPMLAIFR
jgi:hypothetical protein